MSNVNVKISNYLKNKVLVNGNVTSGQANAFAATTTPRPPKRLAQPSLSPTPAFLRVHRRLRRLVRQPRVESPVAERRGPGLQGAPAPRRASHCARRPAPGLRAMGTRSAPQSAQRDLRVRGEEGLALFAGATTTKRSVRRRASQGRKRRPIGCAKLAFTSRRSKPGRLSHALRRTRVSIISPTT